MEGPELAASTAKECVPPKPGETIAGKYLLTGILGEGGMAVVFEATHVRLRQRVAIKVLRPRALANLDIARRFEMEARAVARLGGLGITQVTDVDVLPTGLPYIVMEFLEGHTLARELELVKPMPIEAAVDYIHQAALALVEAHAAGIVHRDLKPENLFLCDLRPTTTRRLVKILDFGISKVLEEDVDRSTPTFSSFGTPGYMSPEQIRSAGSVDARSDIWALGVILWEVLAGRSLFEGPATAICVAIATEAVPEPRTLRPDLPEALAAAIVRCLHKNPAERYQSAQELADALEPFAPRERVASIVAQRPRRPARSLSDLGDRSSAPSLPDLGDPTLLDSVDPLAVGAKDPTVALDEIVHAPTVQVWESRPPPPVRSTIRRALTLGAMLAAGVGFSLAVVFARSHPGVEAVPATVVAEGVVSTPSARPSDTAPTPPDPPSSATTPPVESPQPSPTASPRLAPHPSKGGPRAGAPPAASSSPAASSAPRIPSRL